MPKNVSPTSFFSFLAFQKIFLLLSVFSKWVEANSDEIDELADAYRSRSSIACLDVVGGNSDLSTYKNWIAATNEKSDSLVIRSTKNLEFKKGDDSTSDDCDQDGAITIENTDGYFGAVSIAGNEDYGNFVATVAADTNYVWFVYLDRIDDYLTTLPLGVLFNSQGFAISPDSGMSILRVDVWNVNDTTTYSAFRLRYDNSSVEEVTLFKGLGDNPDDTESLLGFSTALSTFPQTIFQNGQSGDCYFLEKTVFFEHNNDTYMGMGCGKRLTIINPEDVPFDGSTINVMNATDDSLTIVSDDKIIGFQYCNLESGLLLVGSSPDSNPKQIDVINMTQLLEEKELSLSENSLMTFQGLAGIRNSTQHYYSLHDFGEQGTVICANLFGNGKIIVEKYGYPDSTHGGIDSIPFIEDAFVDLLLPYNSNLTILPDYSGSFPADSKITTVRCENNTECMVTWGNESYTLYPLPLRTSSNADADSSSNSLLNRLNSPEGIGIASGVGVLLLLAGYNIIRCCTLKKAQNKKAKEMEKPSASTVEITALHNPVSPPNTEKNKSSQVIINIDDAPKIKRKKKPGDPESPRGKQKRRPSKTKKVEEPKKQEEEGVLDGLTNSVLSFFGNSETIPTPATKPSLRA